MPFRFIHEHLLPARQPFVLINVVIAQLQRLQSRLSHIIHHSYQPLNVFRQHLFKQMACQMSLGEPLCQTNVDQKSHFSFQQRISCCYFGVIG